MSIVACPEVKRVLTSTRKESQDKVTNVSVLCTEIKIRRDSKRKEEPVHIGKGGTQGTSTLLQFLETCGGTSHRPQKRKTRKATN
jgi:hypothetical protein